MVSEGDRRPGRALDPGRYPGPVTDARKRLLIALGLTLCLGGLLVLAAGPLAALPALLAFLPLLRGHYLGSRALERAIVARRRSARPSPAPASRPALAERAFMARGGRLIADSLAERPPPLATALA
jgi:hypothetical protein